MALCTGKGPLRPDDALAKDSTIRTLFTSGKGILAAREGFFRPMKHKFRIGDHVEWSSEAGRVRGTIKKMVTSAIKFKTYIVRASQKEPQYLIKSDKTDHLAMHKGTALKKIRKTRRK